MSVVKQVKVDNWGIYFLQRLKHFFNRTDYCDLTLQFQDNAQLKVHRLVLSACTEYFELLERTCEMYEDRLVMPDDLQADVVVPIVNFMYTGQLEFKMDLLEKLYQTSLVMNMPVLSKLLDAHRQILPTVPRPVPAHSYSKNSKPDSFKKKTVAPSTSSSGSAYKRSYTSAFETVNEPKPKRSQVITKVEPVRNGHQTVMEPYFPIVYEKNKHTDFEPRPTRYELPEELDEDNITDNSFSNISYNTKPLLVHPETVKQYGVKKPSLFEDPSTSKKFLRTSPNDIVECRKISMNSSIFDDGPETTLHEEEINHEFKFLHREEHTKDASQLFDEIIEEGPKLTIETKDSKQVNNIDHAKIISEVLKKYPHLMKSNKNIKLKILDTPGKVKKSKSVISQIKKEPVSVKPEPAETPDFTYQSDVLDSKEAARLIALGAENIHGPWICLICGTPGRALHFTTYYKFRRHLVEVHNEKPMPKICEYCGLKSLKRNYLLYHLFTKHGVPPPPNYSFPKCNYCNYVALTEALLVKHKMSHNEHKGFRCYVCSSSFGTSNQLLAHIQESGHKYSAERKANLQCIYCLKVFLREANLYTHLKTNHKKAATSDGIIENSDEESYAPPVRTDKMKQENQIQKQNNEPANVHVPLDDSYESIQYQLEQKADGNIELVTKTVTTPKTQTKHKILNSGLESQSQIIQSSNTTPKKKVFYDNNQESNNFTEEEAEQPSSNSEEILLIDNSEYIIQNNQLIPKKEIANDEYIIPTSIPGNSQGAMPAIAAETLLEFQNTQRQSSGMILKKRANINQPIQIVVSNEEEYKALMASNHSIIFDNSDPNKTLTVLTSQPCTPLETSTIDLEASQSNEINIPDNYPMSVSETITGNNSNIVVLYSHPIDDQNKHFHQQISQSLGAQYVQSSSIISQNFQTVTTCSPIIGEHAVSTSIEQQWQQTLPVSTSQTTVTSVENITNTNLDELPEIQLATSKELPVEITQQSLVTTNEMGQTVDVYNQAEGIPISQSMIMTQNPILITEEITTNNEGNINSEDENPETNSLNRLQQNIITSEIPEHSSVIVENSSQLDLSELTVVETLCEPTDSGSNDESVVTANIEMIETQPVETEEVTEQVEIAQLEQEMPECPTNTPGYEQEIINPTEEVTEYIAETSELNVELSEHTAEIIESSQEITEPTEDTAEQTQQITEHSEEVTEHIQEHSECTNEISETRKESISKHLTEISELQSEIHIPEYAHKDVEAKDTLTSIDIQQEKVYQSINIPNDLNDNDSVTVDVQHSLQSQEKLVLNNYEGNSHFIEVDGTQNQIIVEKVQSDNEDETNISEENMETGNENAPQINSCITTEPASSKINNKPEIENLTSEWSEDDSDSQPEKAITDSKETEPSSEVEESIESIQQEINKHLATSAQKAVGKEQKKDLDAVEIVVPVNKLPNEKISSLLDDWDDNDTQEEDTTTDQTTEEKVASEKENSDKIEPVDKKSVDENINKDNVPKPDNIKSLVSDWDEEEE